ncbi:MAG TPA: (Fe-S)-binding protein [Desulfomonilaceae bacterium]|nr:(Fe-S)-binding protein [Desulfomonilaceae bacterium]
MLLRGYTKEMFLPKCNPNFQSVHCVAHLEQDISEVLPYLNTVMGGGDYIESPASLTLRIHGKLITLHAREIFVNALNDEVEADKILEWLKKEINAAWDDRKSIQPSFDSPAAPQMLAVLKLLPRTNCGKCGLPTCMVFAVRTAEGSKGAEDCPELVSENKVELEEYLGRFHFDYA